MLFACHSVAKEIQAELFQKAWRLAWLKAPSGAHLGRFVCTEHAVVTLGFGSLTKHSDEGLGSSHRHSEDGAGVLALVCQGHIADANAELMGCGFNQLNPIISKGWGEIGRIGSKAFTGIFHIYLQFQVSFFGMIWAKGEKLLLNLSSLWVIQSLSWALGHCSQKDTQKRWLDLKGFLVRHNTDISCLLLLLWGKVTPGPYKT